MCCHGVGGVSRRREVEESSSRAVELSWCRGVAELMTNLRLVGLSSVDDKSRLVRTSRIGDEFEECEDAEARRRILFRGC